MVDNLVYRFFLLVTRQNKPAYRPFFILLITSIDNSNKRKVSLFAPRFVLKLAIIRITYVCAYDKCHTPYSQYLKNGEFYKIGFDLCRGFGKQIEISKAKLHKKVDLAKCFLLLRIINQVVAKVKTS